MSRATQLRRRLRRTLLARRRPLAALCAAAAVGIGLQAAAAPADPTTAVLVAAHDLAGGARVQSDDLRLQRLRSTDVPDGALIEAAAAIGRTTTGAVRAGEPVTDVRLVTGNLLAAYPGRVAAPVRIADAAAVRLLRTGDRIDILAADPRGSGSAVTAAADVPVIALPTATGSGAADSAFSQGALLLVAVTPPVAMDLAKSSVSSVLSVVIKR